MNYLDMIDPSDPMSVLVAADWLEDSGRTTEAEALRTLAPPLDSYSNGYGFGDGYDHGYGEGDGYGSGDSDGCGSGFGYGNGYDSYYGDGDGYGYMCNLININNYLSCMRIFLKD